MNIDSCSDRVVLWRLPVRNTASEDDDRRLGNINNRACPISIDNVRL
jgi:hypothetical protein